MALYLGTDKVKVYLNGVLCNFATWHGEGKDEPQIMGGLVTADGKTLIDANGKILIPKEVI